MTTRKRILIRILLFVATIINDDSTIAGELKSLVTHIQVYAA